MTTSPAAKIGDTVQVPGGMHGVLKFIGPVAAKRGTFAGVQLAPEYASRGKNSGDVDGKYYFKTTVAGSGIFLPLEKAVKVEKEKATPTTAPRTPVGGLSNFNQGGRAITPAGSGLGGLPKPNFSQSVGGHAMGSTGRRESLPRPTSPLRKVTGVGTPTPVGKLTMPKTRPSLGMSRGAAGSGNDLGVRNGASPAVGRSSKKFSQSLRQTMVTPSKGKMLSPLGPEASFDEENGDTGGATPTPMPPLPDRSEEEKAKSEAEIKRLKESLIERDRQLKDQSSSIAEMEKNLAELQALLPSLALSTSSPGKERGADEDGEQLPVDVVALRATVREKNDKIKLLTAEFDANRADFRSTIDTLEMASSETERVYEKRVDELLEEVRGLQDRSEDVAGLAEQMRQLEELVQELEEGLEDARRGEAEARGEVEFLRGEVERGRAEVRRLREGVLNGEGDGGGEEIEELRALLEQKDDEIWGLKAIVQEMNRKGAELPATNGTPGSAPNYRVSRELERQITELKALLSRKNDREEELESEVSRLRSNSKTNNFGRYPPPPLQSWNSGGGSVSEKHKSAGTNGSHRLSDRTVIPSSTGQLWRDASSAPGSPEKNKDDHLRSQSHGQRLGVVDEGSAQRAGYDEDGTKSTSGITDTSASSAPLWCEICEEGGHDILTCGNMFGSKGMREKTAGTDIKQRTSSESQRSGREVIREGLRCSHDDNARPAPLTMRSRSEEDVKSWSSTPKAAPSAPLPPPPVMAPAKTEENLAGMVPGKSSGVIDADKWCALCERDGHESVDCPFEDAF